MILAKIQKPFLTPLTFSGNENFVWASWVSHPSYVQPAFFDSNFFDFSDVNQTPLNISRVYVDNIQYSEQPTLALCRSTEKSFYFDVGSQILYIHVDHSKRMDSSLFSATQIIGFTNTDVFYDENNIEYLPLILGSLNLEKEVDKFVNKRLGLINNTLTSDNKGQDFDFLIQNTVAGSDIKYFYISQEDIDLGKKGLTPIYTGYIVSSEITTERASIRLEDKRGQLNQKISNTFFDSTTYPNIADEYIGELIPEGYGDLFNIPAFCTNGNLTSGDVTYKYATDGTTLTSVYVNIDDVWILKTPTATDATNCEFTLSSADGRTSNGSARKARVICTLRNIKNPGSILIDMISRYLNIPFDQEFYDPINWSIESDLLEDMYVYINERKSFFEYIELIQNSASQPFIFDITPTGKFVIKVDDITRAISQHVSYIDNIDDEKSIETNFDEYATDVRVYYKENYESNKTLNVLKDDYKDDTYELYRFYKELEFDVNSLDSAVAEIKAERALKEYKIARPILRFRVDCVSCVQVLDVITIDNSVYIDDEKVREYNGFNKIKVKGVFNDLELEQATIEGYVINDIVSKGTEVYNQGSLYNQTLYNRSLYSASLVYQPTPG